MAVEERLRKAISKARAGYELSARDLFIDIVEDYPDNKLAWLWLIELLDDRDDLIIACEAVLEIDPSINKVRIRLNELLRAKTAEKKKQENLALAKVDAFLAEGNKIFALSRLRKILQENRNSEAAWELLAKHTTDLREKEQALARIHALDMGNKDKEMALKRAHYFRLNPLELAKSYEERGDIDKAIDVYADLTEKAQGRTEWDRIIREISRLEGMKDEKIVHISPKVTISRLSLGPPLIFFLMLVFQIGYDFHYFTFLMGMEFIMVVFGSFLAAVSAVGSEHSLWKKFGNAAGRGSKGLRVLVGAAGISIMFLPFILLGVDAFERWMTVFKYLGYD